MSTKMAGYKRYRKDGDVSYALGITLTFELLRYKKDYVTRVYVHSEMNDGDTLEKLRQLCEKERIEMVHTDKIFRVLSQKENCYVIGEFRKYERKLSDRQPHLVLVNPSNAGNLGTIMRSALGFGFCQMAVIRPAADIFSPKVVRASMGAIFSMDFVYFDSFEEYQGKYGKREMYPFMLQAEQRIYDIRPSGVYSLIFGNEATGLPAEFLKIGKSVIIPHSDRIDSLNLQTAVSIAMYEVTKTLDLFSGTD